MKEILDLQRLEGGARRYEFPKKDGTNLVAYAKLPTSEDFAAAISEAGVDVRLSENLEPNDPLAVAVGARLGAAKEYLAAYCLIEIEGVDVPKERGPFGLRRVTEAGMADLDVILRRIGADLYGATTVKPVEGER
jgi:hypothetical protein